MITPEIGWALAVAAAAGLMRGFAGVGSGMLMAPFFAQLFGPVATVGIIILMEIVVTAQLIPTVWQQIKWPVVGPMGIAAAVMMPIGSWLLISLDPADIQFGIALLVTLTALVLMTGWRYEGHKPIAATLGVGALSGLLMSVTSLGNPPVMLYLLSSRDDAATNRANFTGYFAVTLLALLAVMLIGGLIAPDTVLVVAALLPVFMFATWLGSRMFRKSNEKIYRRVALLTLLAAGLYGMTRS